MKTIKLIALVLLSACTSEMKIHYGEDVCHYCKMTIVDKRFACVVESTTGKHYKYDDLFCLRKENVKGEQYVALFAAPHTLTPIIKTELYHDHALQSPMGGNTAAKRR